MALFTVVCKRILWSSDAALSPPCVVLPHCRPACQPRVSAGATLIAQIPARNVNMVAGTTGRTAIRSCSGRTNRRSPRRRGTPASGRRQQRLPDRRPAGSAGRCEKRATRGLSVYKSFDGGQRWSSTLLPWLPAGQSTPDSPRLSRATRPAADPVVRAGTHGLIYYNGLVFDRGEGGKSGIFLARFIDTNSQRERRPDFVSRRDAWSATSNGAAFLDKPWMAVDIPRGNNPVMCVVGGTPNGATVKRNGHARAAREGTRTNVHDDGLNRVPAGAVYVAYTSITGDGADLRAEIFLKRSLDCGATWSAPMRVSSSADAINQGAMIAIDPARRRCVRRLAAFCESRASRRRRDDDGALPVGGGTIRPARAARRFAANRPPSAALERIFEHRKKRAQPTVVAGNVESVDQGTYAL